MKMNQVILIYELVPDNTKIYHLFVDDHDLSIILSCAGTYGGASNNLEWENKKCDGLSKFLTDKDDQQIDTNKPLIIPKETNDDVYIVHTGWLL